MSSEQSSALLSLRRCTARCGCSEAGPGASCEEGCRLFEAVRQACTALAGVPPSESGPWSLYETARFAYYRHLGERVDPLLLHALLPSPRQAAQNWLSRLLSNTAGTPADASMRAAADILFTLRPDLAIQGSAWQPSPPEIVGYDFGFGQPTCHWCVYTDMGLLEYTARRAELLERAIWDTDEERVAQLDCARCRHPLLALVFGKRQSLPYRDPAAFIQRCGVCYIPELGEPRARMRRYRHQDFLALARGDELLAARLFRRCSRQEPGEALQALLGGGE